MQKPVSNTLRCEISPIFGGAELQGCVIHDVYSMSERAVTQKTRLQNVEL